MQDRELNVSNLRNSKYVLNLPGVEYVRVDRSSVLGNPFELVSESQRELVVRAFEVWFWNVIVKDDTDTKTFTEKGLKLAKAYRRPSAKEIQEELLRICLLAKRKRVTLLCWCSPKMCHGEVILRYLKEADKWIDYLSLKLQLEGLSSEDLDCLASQRL